MRSVTRKLPIALVLLSLYMVSCTSADDAQIAPNADPAESQGSDTVTQESEVNLLASSEASGNAGGSAYGLTYQQPDGNRLVDGQGRLPDIEPVDISLSGTPIWLVAASFGEGSLWVAILDNGKVEAFQVTGQQVKPVAIEPASLPPGMPPMLVIPNDSPMLVTGPPLEASDLTHAVKLASPAESIAYISSAGDLAIETNGDAVQLSVNAMLDARLVMDESGRLLFLSDPTTRYGHGVVGDEFEAGSITMVEASPSHRVSLRLETDPSKVIEGIAPIWADLDGDGIREIIVTESGADQGAQIVVYDEPGTRVATGPAIGTAFRWRHQLAVARFGPKGELELASVLTPHIGGVVEFYQMRGDKLEIVAQVPGYSSHTIGSRNLDRAIAGDLDGDGRIELLVPDQAQQLLGAIRRTSEWAETAWEIPIGGRLNTNLMGVALTSGDLALGAGREDGVLRLWLP
jgi:hypothetical protein